MVWMLVIVHFATMHITDSGLFEAGGLYRTQFECESKKSGLNYWFSAHGAPDGEPRWLMACVPWNTLGPSL